MAINLKKEYARGPDGVISLKDRPAAPEALQRPVPRPRPRRGAQPKHVIAGLAAGVGILLIAALYVAVERSGIFAPSGSHEAQALVAKVGTHMLLPNELPTVATVSDLHALEGQLFFKNAKVGDKVLIFVQAQKAVLYRPSSNMVIEVGPVTGGTQ